MKLHFILPILLTASTAFSQEPDSSSALFNLRETERNFARESVMIGRNAAFVKNFAEESALFTDKWITNGRQFTKERKMVPVVLKWEPEFMDIALSRDFGISTGPWEAQEYRPNTEPLSTGYFLTVWKKQSDGVWMVILDGGSATPVSTGKKHSFSFPEGADKTVANPPILNVEALSKELLEREKQFLAEWKMNPVPSTYSSYLEPNMRMQHSSHLPTVNPDSINYMIARSDKSIIWKSAGSGAASSGDLGYTYGLLIIPGNPEVTRGHYVRIWKKQPGTKWKIELEMMNFE